MRAEECAGVRLGQLPVNNLQDARDQFRMDARAIHRLEHDHPSCVLSRKCISARNPSDVMTAGTCGHHILRKRTQEATATVRKQIPSTDTRARFLDMCVRYQTRGVCPQCGMLRNVCTKMSVK